MNFSKFSKVFGEGGLLHFGTEDYCFWGLLCYFKRVTGGRITVTRSQVKQVKGKKGHGFKRSMVKKVKGQKGHGSWVTGQKGQEGQKVIGSKRS